MEERREEGGGRTISNQYAENHGLPYNLCAICLCALLPLFNEYLSLKTEHVNIFCVPYVYILITSVYVCTMHTCTMCT